MHGSCSKLSLYIDNDLWVPLLALIREDLLERGFYLTGSRVGDKIVVYEAYEFKYDARGETMIISDPMGRIYLTNTFPVGLDIVGIIHSHPFDQTTNPSPSHVDMEFSREYPGCVVLTVNPSGYHSAIISVGDEVMNVDVVIKSYKDEAPMIVLLNELYCVLPRLVSDVYMSLYLPKMYAEKIYQLYLMSKYKDGKIIVPKYRWVWVKQVFEIPHRIYEGELGKKQYDLLRLNPLTIDIHDT